MNVGDWIRYGDYRAFLPLAAACPRPLAYRLADWRGARYYRSRTDSRRQARNNISRVFTHLSSREIERIVVRHFQTRSRDEMETHWYGRSLGYFQQFVEIRGLESLREAIRSRKGVLLFSGHLGSVGLFLVLMGKHGIGLEIVGRPVEPECNPMPPGEYEHVRHRVRLVEKAVGRPFILTGKGNYPLVAERLVRGEVVLLLIDVPSVILKRTVPVRFLGLDCDFGDGIASLYTQSQAELFYWHVHQDRASGWHRIEIRRVTSAVGRTLGNREIMQKLAAMLEQTIRRFPEDWWAWDSLAHFRSAPQGVPGG